jgi:hypothetical protein
MFKSNPSVIYLFSLVIAITIVSCTSVKPYQRAHLEDRDMKFGHNEPERFEHSAHTYREGASGGSMGKSSGGCGCN